jgi:heme exporter protein CcmD
MSTLEVWFSMGGRGWYVWGAVGVTLLVLLAEWIVLARQRRALQRPAQDQAWDIGLESS